MEIAKKVGANVFEGFTNVQLYLIDHPVFQAQTNDLVEALHFLTQFYHASYEVSLIEGMGPDTHELDWRDMLVRVHFDSTAQH